LNLDAASHILNARQAKDSDAIHILRVSGVQLLPQVSELSLNLRGENKTDIKTINPDKFVEIALFPLINCVFIKTIVFNPP